MSRKASERQGANQQIEAASFSRAAAPPPEAAPGAKAKSGRLAQEFPLDLALKALGATLAFALLLMLVLLFLPDETRVAALPEAPPQPAPFEQARLDFQQQKAGQLAKDLLRAQLALEDLGAALWAGEALKESQAAIEAADQLFRNQAFDAAVAAYEAALADLQALEANAETVLAEETAKGGAALAAGDAQAALVALAIATAIDPKGQELQSLLGRAENLDQVLALAQDGASAEKSGRLSDALTLYQEAEALDPEWPPAAEGVQRVTEAIRLQDVSRAMSRGFKALADRDYAAAKAGFQEAARLAPESDQPEEGLLQVEQAEQTDRIAGYQQAALAALARDAWQEAINAYEAALALEAGLVFATEGLAHAQARLAAETAMQRFLADPTLLQTDEALIEAQRTLVAASRFKQRSAQTDRHMDALAQLVLAARVQLPLTITSDNRTEVSILRVAPLGRLERHEMSLIPGRYVLVGKREGYRDVRHELALLAHAEAPTVHIACTERI